MRNIQFSTCGAMLLSALLLAGGPAVAFQDPVDVPATMSERMLRSPLTAVAAVGGRTVAVGQRGHIALSDDAGQHWRQARVPVSVDLVDLSFPSERQGWAVGHGGVVLHSSDGGETWERQLDGREAIRLVLEHFGKDAGSAREDAASFVEREKVLVNYGGTQPLMAVHFLDESTGFIGGLFNRLFQTRDGGKTWEPWQDRIDNPNELHFYGIESDDKAVYITGEMGMVWRKRHGEERFVQRPTGYDGTLFGIRSNGRTLVAYGMRGSLYRSDDQGDSWQRVALESRAGITSAAFLADGSLLLSNLSGEVARSLDGGRTFEVLKLSRSMPFFGLAARADGQLALVGAAGVQHEALALGQQKQSEGSTVVKNMGASMDIQWGDRYGSAN
ncbi:YCF48-related protein [Pseudomonas sp. MOB-449]|nr:YCF48-related protein [Pseudomonas sp. MOB-449]